MTKACEAGHRVLLPALCIVLLLGGCRESHQSSHADESRQPDSDHADPQYATVKQTFVAMWDDGSIDPKSLDFPDEPFDVVSCATGESYVGGDDALVPLAGLAIKVVRLEKSLPTFGYPRSVWGERVDAYEREQLQALSSGAETPVNDVGYDLRLVELADALTHYRENDAPQSRPVMIEGGCGAGEVGIVVATEPAGGTVAFIPVFFHKLCEVQKLDPQDPAQCDRWRESVDGALFDAAGDYIYHSRWPDGREKRGRLSLTNLTEGQTVTFRP